MVGREGCSARFSTNLTKSKRAGALVLPALASLCYNSGRPASGLFFGQFPLGRGAMVAQRTLNPYILVRIRAPQLNCSW